MLDHQTMHHRTVPQEIDRYTLKQPNNKKSDIHVNKGESRTNHTQSKEDCGKPTRGRQQSGGNEGLDSPCLRGSHN